MELNSFQGLNIGNKVLHCVLAVFLNPPLLWYFAKSKFSFGLSRNLRFLKNRTLLEVNPGPLSKLKMELFVTIVYG